jgi:HAD superfamily hydrolase (TIGR01509 family)
VRAVVFDLDGVIADSEHVNRTSAFDAFTAFGHPLPASFARRIVGRHPIDYAPEFAREVGLPDERVGELLQHQDALYRERWVRGVREIPGAVDAVRRLGGAGFRLGIATSAGRLHLDACLARFGLEGAFQARVSKDDVRRRKPDPEAYRLALARLEVAPPDAVAVEDTPHGVAAARAAGMSVFAVRSDAVPDEDLVAADAILDRVGDVVGRVALP